MNTATSSHEMEKESSSTIIDNNFCAYATRRKLCEKNRSNNMCVWKQKRGGNVDEEGMCIVDEEGMCIDKRVEEFFESIKRCRYNTKKCLRHMIWMVVVSRSSICVHIISRYILIGGISLEELDYALSSNVRQYSSLQKAFIAADRNEDDELDRLEFRKFAKDTILDGSIFDCDTETTTIFKASESVVGSMEAIEELNSGCTLSGRFYVLALVASVAMMLMI